MSLSTSIKMESGWQILPDLVANLLDGRAEKQRFKMYENGTYQGTIQIRLLKEGQFKPRVRTSGSLNVVYMAEPVKDFIFSSHLAPFYHLHDRDTACLIHSIFLSVMKGIEKEEFSLSDDARIQYRYGGGTIRFYKVSESLNKEQEAIVNVASDFFGSVNVGDLFGKIKI